ncbi:hypothetical protein L3Q82_020979 [Scortum barcoo]|uniref:Uncharacterized protein n=1 Tax=Scortum barcoo TaxID=214431 RepID=A0ACB8VAB9_9TELE|nr:hypothetical protein L3Q82_020979 [Scortum barcoo]
MAGTMHDSYCFCNSYSYDSSRCNLLTRKMYKRHLSTTSNSQTPNSTMAKTKELSKDTRNKIVDLHQAGKTESAIGTPSLNRHLTVVEGFVCPNDPRSYVVGGITLRHAQAHHGERKNKDRYVARIGRHYRAPPWSQAWGWGSQASAWWPGLCPRDPAGLSLKWRRGPAFQ